MNDEFVVSNQELVDEVQSKLKKQGIFSNIDQFILLFNQKFINTSKPEIKDLAKLIAQAYENVLFKNNHLYITSKTEGALKNSLYVLNEWKIVLALKRVASSLIEDGNEDNTKMILDDKNPGFIFIEHVENDDVTLEKYNDAEKITTSKDTIPSNPFINSLIHDYGEDDHKGYFIAKDLVNIDTSFVDTVNKVVDDFLKDYKPVKASVENNESEAQSDYSNADAEQFNNY